MAKAFLDTTILADALLKSGERGRAASEALSHFEHCSTTQYVIKEFKAGVLYNFVWMHNVLADEPSMQAAAARLQTLSRSQSRNMLSSALEALTEAEGSIANVTLAEWATKYGETVTQEAARQAELRDSLGLLIMKAWARKKSLLKEVTTPLECYDEVDPYFNGERIEVDPHLCRKGASCCIAKIMRQSKEEVVRMRFALDRILGELEAEAEAKAKALQEAEANPGAKPAEKPKKAAKPKINVGENGKRRKALRALERKHDEISQTECRQLGDAAIVFLAPRDAPILTTNAKDHRPLADAIGKTVLIPAEVEAWIRMQD